MKEEDAINKSKGKLKLFLLIISGIISTYFFLIGLSHIIKGLINQNKDTAEAMYMKMGIFFFFIGAIATVLVINGISKNIKNYWQLDCNTIDQINQRTPVSNLISYFKILFIALTYIIGLGLNVLGIWLLVIITMRSANRILKRMVLAVFLFPLLVVLIILFPLLWIPAFSKIISIICLKLESIYFPIIEDTALSKNMF